MLLMGLIISLAAVCLAIVVLLFAGGFIVSFFSFFISRIQERRHDGRLKAWRRVSESGGSTSNR